VSWGTAQLGQLLARGYPHLKLYATQCQQEAGHLRASGKAEVYELDRHGAGFDGCTSLHGLDARALTAARACTDLVEESTLLVDGCQLAPHLAVYAA
jgi:hypothetical protein